MGNEMLHGVKIHSDVRREGCERVPLHADPSLEEQHLLSDDLRIPPIRLPKPGRVPCLWYVSTTACRRRRENHSLLSSS